MVRTAVMCRPPISEDQYHHNQNQIVIERGAHGHAIVLPTGPYGQQERLQPSAAYGWHSEDANLMCEREVEPLLLGLTRGESAAVIAYGATGSGKSFSMGTESGERGPWENSVGAYVPRRLYELAGEQSLERLTVQCAMLEVSAHAVT